jgi:DNA invertase Pin-like site-specific DNA recombinase
VGEQIDTRSAAGRLVLNVLASVSQWEREAIGERTATAMRYKAKRGEYTGGQTPYGRRVGPPELGPMQPDLPDHGERRPRLAPLDPLPAA